MVTASLEITGAARLARVLRAAGAMSNRGNWLRRAGTFLGGCVVAAALSGCTGVLESLESAVQSGPTLHEVRYQLDGWCDGSCLGLAEWDQQVQDDPLYAALILAYHYAPEWRR